VVTYLQFLHQVNHALRLGLLAPGQRLPTAKEVVAKLAINPNAVLKVYRKLEREGLVAGKPGLGTFASGRWAGRRSLSTRGCVRAGTSGCVTDVRQNSTRTTSRRCSPPFARPTRVFQTTSLTFA
jgi:GntR family transcriptional regulator